MSSKIYIPAFVVLLTFALFCLVSCSSNDDDPISSDNTDTTSALPGLLGEYNGTYAYTTGVGTQSEQTTEYPITFRFSDMNYWLWNAGTDELLCEPSGHFAIVDGVRLAQTEDGCPEGTTVAGLNPQGVFSLRTSSNSLILTQTVSTIRKELRLVPAS